MRPSIKYMDLSIKQARKNLKSLAGGPFGACIVKGNKVISVARNSVLKADATCHAEINAIRLASKRLKTHILSGCVIYSTTEPCTMCFSTIHWSRIDTIIYGTTINDVAKLGFNELYISNRQMKRLGKSNMDIIEGFHAGECKKLLQDWNTLNDRKLY